MDIQIQVSELDVKEGEMREVEEKDEMEDWKIASAVLKLTELILRFGGEQRPCAFSLELSLGFQDLTWFL